MDVRTTVEDYPDYPKQVKLRDGTTVLLRLMVGDDHDRLRLFFKELSQHNRRYFAQDAVLDKMIGQWCLQLDYDRVLPVLAVARQGENEKVLADGTLHTESHGSTAHVARIRWVVADDMYERGLGRLLVRELLRRAHGRGIQKVQANLLEQDWRSIQLLRRLGFRKEAVFRRHAMDLSGALHDVIVLAKDTGQQLQSMEELTAS